ncbi:monocarboxylate transporter 12-like isoform X2 [Mya arenaria]|nr:monocarboxylate transporter 12-like isoform X2 [Mya arenaria]XP_052805375.1 monocarboxylate transporter 12-like isoform X2 [Mya arenaria]XP_052805376.1 monocarboxylate transporter 12-like isoform X2 [Mya arenaria]XP_052805377.1 monocarboxylate transporter 12-like isoform X2 [Mya arenaria]
MAKLKAETSDTKTVSNGKASAARDVETGSGNGSCSSGLAPIPPDGGWGWVVTMASFMVGVIVDGICFTFGFFFADFQAYFGSNRSTTASINSVQTGTYLTVGPLVGALVNKFGCRSVAMVGGVVTSVSFFLCTFSPNVETMIVLYGLCGGIGFGLMYLPAIVMVGYYFDKRRALATGIAVCGSGIGSFVFAPLSEYLLSQYSWKGAMWIISAISLNGFVCAALYRPLSYTEEDEGVRSAAEAPEDELGVEVDSRVPLFKPTLNIVKNITPIYRCKSLEACNQKPGDKTAEIARLGHSMFLDAEPRSRKHAKGRHVLKPLERKDIFYSGSIQHLPEYVKAGNEEKFVRSMLHLNEHETDAVKDTKTCAFDCQKVFAEMFDFSLLKSPTFVIYLFSCFLCMIGFFTPFIYLPDITSKYGMSSSQSAWIISTIGIVNTVARILVGYVSDKSWADAILINTVALVIAGVTSMFVPFYRIYAVLIVYAILFGFSIAAFVSLRSIIIVELLGIDKLTSSFGLVVLAQGLSTFVGSPIAGALYDATGDYKASFYLSGTVIAISGLICLPLRRLKRWEVERDKKREEELVQLKHGTETELLKMSNGTGNKQLPFKGGEKPFQN